MWVQPYRGVLPKGRRKKTLTLCRHFRNRPPVRKLRRSRFLKKAGKIIGEKTAQKNLSPPPLPYLSDQVYSSASLLSLCNLFLKTLLPPPYQRYQAKIPSQENCANCVLTMGWDVNKRFLSLAFPPLCPSGSACVNSVKILSYISPSKPVLRCDSCLRRWSFLDIFAPFYSWTLIGLI